MVLFDLSDCSEVRGDDREAFLVGHIGIGLISLNALVSFFVDGNLKIIFGGTNGYGISRDFCNKLSAGQEVQKDLGVTEFVRGSFVKCISDREEAFFHSFLCIESVPSVGLGFIQIRSCEVLLSLCTCNTFCFSHFYILIYEWVRRNPNE